jgi:hypothetical protein
MHSLDFRSNNIITQNSGLYTERNNPYSHINEKTQYTYSNGEKARNISRTAAGNCIRTDSCSSN